MGKYYETVLPAGYREIYHIDAANKKIGIAMNLAAVILMIAAMILCVVLIRPSSFTFTVGPLFIMLAVLFIYLVAHELVHGAAYKLMTGQKLSYGFSATVAFCGVPDIYVYRKTALVSLLAPFTVFSIIFIAAMILIPNDFHKILCAFLFSAHFGGCVGDLYDTILYLTRFRDPGTLMRDTGPAQTFYIKEERN